MGRLFQQGGLTTPNSAMVDPSSGQATAVGTPSQMMLRAGQQLKDTQNANAASDIAGNPQMPAQVSHLGTPSFSDATRAGAPPGGANALSPGLNKAGKLATLLTSGLQGAMAGRAKSEETVAATGGRRSGGAGMGFEAGYQLPWQRAGMQQQYEQEQAKTRLLQQQGDVIQTPGGPMPLALAKVFYPAELRRQGQLGAADIRADAAQKTAAANVQGRKDVANINAGAKPAHTITVGNQTLQWNPATKSYDTTVGTAGQTAKMGSVKPEIYAQLGAPPMNDPEKLKAWGTAAEAITNRMASSGAAARGAAYGAYRPVQAINPETGNVEWQYAKQAVASGAAPAGPGAKAMSQQAQFKDIETASVKTRDAIKNLDVDFTPEQRAKLIFAMDQQEPGLIHNMSDAMLGTERLTDKQKDFVIWATQMQERALSLRSVAGMGQGSESLRAAIQATLPNVRSADKNYALKQMDAFDQQVAALKPGILGVKRNQPTPQNNPPAGARIRDYTQLGK